MGPCGVHVQRMNSGHPWSAWIVRQGRGSQFWEELDWGGKLLNTHILQENVEISLCRAKPVTEGVTRVPTM